VKNRKAIFVCPLVAKLLFYKHFSFSEFW